MSMKKTNKKPLLFIGVALGALVVIGLIIFLAARGATAPVAYQYAAVTRGAVQTTIASTGSISAQKTVDVGTQVSGQLVGVYADFNDRVRQGQVLARLDTTLLALAVRTATADRLKAQAQFDLAQKDYENNKLLHDKALISDYDFESSRVARDSANAARLSADANLSRANINLNYAVITSPIDGVVINRTVETGQTVAASLSAPTLFTIAEDLSSIQIKAYVAESDIGSIKRGQKVSFTVTTYPDDTFTGKVDIIHLQSETVQNVVNYVVMVNAANPGQKLMPGMTATVEFITDQRENALLIPNSALQFKPPENLLAAYLQERAAQRREDVSGASPSPAPTASATVSPTDATAPRQRRGRQGGSGTGQPTPQLSDDQRAVLRQERQQRNGQAGANGASPDERTRNFLNSLPADVKMLWTLDGNGKLTGVTVRTGLSDGQKTEIISDRVKEGMEFLSGLSTGTAVQRNNTQQGRGPRMFF
jgi:HlyD family secretion protein